MRIATAQDFETTTKISAITAKSILTKAELSLWFVSINEYHGHGFMFVNNAFHWVGRDSHQCEITLKLISYLNNAGIAYKIGVSQGRWSVSTQAIILTNGGK